jgi:hypothetical protein
MKSKAPILYCAPGAGVGHLVRACAISIKLSELGIRSKIVANSIYAEGIACLTGCDIDRIPNGCWESDFQKYAAAVNPELVVLDSFPWGLRGEWIGTELSGLKFVYIARRLKVEAYTQALKMEWDAAAEQVARVIISEPLDAAHEDILKKEGAKIVRLPGRIRFLYERLNVPVPVELERILSRGKTRLIVHSGKEEEISKLVNVAENDVARNGGGDIAVISPAQIKMDGISWFEYFPAAKLFEKAECVITGGGYNVVSELAATETRRLSIPFERKYDDQRGRLNGPDAGVENGGPAAAEYIVSLI